MVAGVAALALALAALGAGHPVIWAWERPEDLRFAGPRAEIAAQSGFIVLSGASVFSRGRRFPLVTAAPPSTAVVHVQIDHRRPLAWSAQQRAETVQAILALARPHGVARLQLDFEVRQSERHVLLDVLSDLRREMPKEQLLSMTALASWCETETWLHTAPVDEIVPMLFRMGPGGAAVRASLEAGGDFADPRCRNALAISTDAPLARAPAGRRVYLFSPRSWTPADYRYMQERIARWAGSG